MTSFFDFLLFALTVAITSYQSRSMLLEHRLTKETKIVLYESVHRVSNLTDDHDLEDQRLNDGEGGDDDNEEDEEQNDSSFLHLQSSQIFEWQHEPFSSCSVTCGDGDEVSEVMCRDHKTGKRVRDLYCDQETKPWRIVRPCRPGKCQAVWTAGEWGSCSAICGGGSSKRFVYCAEEVDHGIYQRTLDRLCQGIKPDSERLCNNEDCPQWHSGQWSKCSKSCGMGVQQRAVVCKRTEALDCIDDMKPVSKRICHQKPCSLQSSDDVRKRRRFGLPETSAVHGKQDPVSIYNYRHQNRGRETASGYSRDTAAVIIIDHPNSKVYLHGMKEAVNPPLLSSAHPTESDGNGGSGNDDDLGTMVPRFERTTTLPRLNIFSTGNYVDTLEQRGPSAAGVHPITETNQLKDNEMELDYYSVLQLEPRNELSLMAAQRLLLVNLLPGTNLRVHCRSNIGHTSSVWMRNGEAISKATLLIRNVRHEQTGVYSCLRGNQISRVSVTVRSPEEIQLEKEARRNATLDDQTIKKLKDDSKFEPSLAGLKLFLNGKLIIAPNYAMLEVIPLSYITASDWSKCQCGLTESVQTRKVSCEFVTEMLSIEVDQLHCARRKLKAITTKKDCSKNCYQWVVGNWKQCSVEPCLSPGIGTRWRLVECSLANGTRVSETRCKFAGDRPLNMERCVHKMCNATWITMHWSQCSVSCGYKGMKTREVRCVWLMDRSLTALDENMCPHEFKPPVQKLCFNPPCASSRCRDESLYCANVPVFDLCHLEQYTRKCCYSCTKNKPYNQITKPEV